MESNPVSVPIPFSILFEDDHFIAINKPPGILVHKTKISEDTQFVLQLLRNQIGQRIYPVHRLDRGTSGVLVFGKTKEAASLLSEQFRDKSVSKKYIAIIRGFVEEEGTINYPLEGKPHLPKQEAITHFKKLKQTEMDFAVNRYPTSRYSLIEVTLETGRRHQIRRHLAHVRHPVIGDKRHGDCKHNKYFALQFNLTRMLLHASMFQFLHPVSKDDILIQADLGEEFKRIITLLSL